jgi:hypothetical protein
MATDSPLTGNTRALAGHPSVGCSRAYKRGPDLAPNLLDGCWAVGISGSRRDSSLRKRLLALVFVGAALVSLAACTGPNRSASQTGLAPLPASPSPSATAEPSPPAASPSPTWMPKPTATWVVLPSPPPTTDPRTPSVANVPRIGLASARAKVASGDAILVDVRPGGSYAAQHIAGAISMPFEQVARRYRELARDKLIIFYCA